MAKNSRGASLYVLTYQQFCRHHARAGDVYADIMPVPDLRRQAGLQRMQAHMRTCVQPFPHYAPFCCMSWLHPGNCPQQPGMRQRRPGSTSSKFSCEEQAPAV